MDAIGTLARGIARHAAADGVHATAIPGLHLIRESRPTAPIHVLHEPALCIVAAGAKRVSLLDLTLDYDVSHHLVVSVDLPLSGHVTRASGAAPYLCFRLDLNPAVLASLVVEAGPAAGSPGRGLHLAETDPALADAAARLVGLLDAPGDAAVLAPLIVREIHYRLLRSPGGDVARRIATGDRRMRGVSRAIARIKEGFAEPLTVAALAREAGMSPSVLHEHFRGVTTTSPLRYQKMLRLGEARRLMVSGAEDAAGAARAVGYGSASQFSRDYARMFGAPPGRDAARLRGAATCPRAPAEERV